MTSLHYADASPELVRLRPILHRLIERLGASEIWLIGSRARGTAREDSDYDLLAVLPDGASREALDPIAAWQLVSGFRIPIDVAPCTLSEFEEEKDEIDTLPREALLRGRCLYMSAERRMAALLDLATQDAEASEVLAAAGNRYAASHCQQAVENLVKAILLRRGIEGGIEHPLDVLIARLPADDPWRSVLEPFSKYTPYATSHRYPTPGGRIPAAPDTAGIVADVAAVKALVDRARGELLAAPK